MLLEFVATVVAGLAGAGVAMLLRRLSGGRLPRFVVPATAGAAMIAFVIWSEYTWFDRTIDALPPSVAVLSSTAERAAWRPWTLVAPVIERFAAIDNASMRHHPDVPDHVMADVYLFDRHLPSAQVLVLVDCADNRRTQVAPGMEILDDGSIEGANWTRLSPDDPLIGAVCPST